MILPLWILGLSGCANIVPIAPSQPFDLEPGQGVLVLHLSSNVPIARIELGASGLIENMPAGDNLWLLEIETGNYRWTRIFLRGRMNAGSTLGRATNGNSRSRRAASTTRE